jgi:hypothetical protein
MAQVQVRVLAETIITVNTEQVDDYDDLQEYLKGVDIEDATSKQLAVAMIRSDEERGDLYETLDEWKVLAVTTLD